MCPLDFIILSLFRSVFHRIKIKAKHLSTFTCNNICQSFVFFLVSQHFYVDILLLYCCIVKDNLFSLLWQGNCGSRDCCACHVRRNTCLKVSACSVFYDSVKYLFAFTICFGKWTLLCSKYCKLWAIKSKCLYFGGKIVTFSDYYHTSKNNVPI